MHASSRSYVRWSLLFLFRWLIFSEEDVDDEDAKSDLESDGRGFEGFIRQHIFDQVDEVAFYLEGGEAGQMCSYFTPFVVVNHRDYTHRVASKAQETEGKHDVLDILDGSSKDNDR